MNKQVARFILDMLPLWGAPTAKVEGLWLVNRPKCLVLRHPDNSNNSPEVQLCSLFIVPSLLQNKIFSWLHIVTSWLSAPFFWWENHCACALVLPWFVCKCARVHVGIPYYYKSSEPRHLFSNPLSMPVTLSPRYFSAPSFITFLLQFITSIKHRHNQR